jgi:adenylate cyclase class 2
VLTFKGPRQKSRFKMRAEWNVDVSDADAMTAILEAAGFRETFYYEKRRQMWRDGACEVTLDLVPFLGWFVEVEGPSEEAIGKTVARIGLADSQVIAKGYVHLLAKHLKQAGQDPSRAAFDNQGARE